MVCGVLTVSSAGDRAVELTGKSAEQLRHEHRREPDGACHWHETRRDWCLQVGLPAVVLGLLGGWWLTRRALAPVAELTDAIKKIHERNLREPLSAHRQRR